MLKSLSIPQSRRKRRRLIQDSWRFISSYPIKLMELIKQQSLPLAWHISVTCNTRQQNTTDSESRFGVWAYGKLYHSKFTCTLTPLRLSLLNFFLSFFNGLLRDSDILAALLLRLAILVSAICIQWTFEIVVDIMRRSISACNSQGKPSVLRLMY